MPSEDESKAPRGDGNERALDIPSDVVTGNDDRSWRRNFTNVEGRPDLLRMEVAGPDSPIDIETVKAQQAIRYFDLTLVNESDLFDGWDDWDSESQRMVRAAVLKEQFDDSYEDLEQRFESSGVVAKEVDFDPDTPKRHDALAGNPKSRR